MKLPTLFFVASLLVFIGCVHKRERSGVVALQFTLKTKSREEKDTQKKLSEQLQAHRLSTYYFSDHVIIGANMKGAAGSDGVFLASDEVRDAESILIDFLHQELSIFVDSKPEQTKAARAVLFRLIPGLPIGAVMGVDSQDQNYRELILGFLVYRALRNAWGQQMAQAKLLRLGQRRAIYESVFKDEYIIQRVLENHQLLTEE